MEEHKMKIDISFIPKKLQSEQLKKLDEKEISRPYSKKKKYFDDDEKMNRFLKARANYLKLESELSNFAQELYKNGKLKLAEKCFQYLKSIGSQSSRVNEYIALIKIKRKSK